MADLVQVRKKAQITLPLSIRKKLGIEEGDFLEVNDKDGEIVLKVKKLVDKDQAWFWTKRWQEGEKEADEDIKAGRVIHFDTVEEAVAYLDDKSREKADNLAKSRS
jgi:antitoxin MazE